jgi:hydroxypyruvate isomerase
MGFMAKLSANISWLFKELPLIERFGAAAASGFHGVEILYPYELPATAVAAALEAHHLELALINLPPGDLQRGERGFAARPGDEARFAAALEAAIDYAAACGCTRLHAMSGQRVNNVDLASHEATLVENLRYAAPRCAAAGITLLIEPLNTRDNPDYVLVSSAQAIAILDRVAQPNVGLQFDIYHAFITEGDVTGRIRALRGRFAHVQIAGYPGRHEPAGGDIDGAAVIAQLDAEGYGGWIGLEYTPVAGTRDGLAWAAPFLQTKARS